MAFTGQLRAQRVHPMHLIRTTRYCISDLANLGAAFLILHMLVILFHEVFDG